MISSRTLLNTVNRFLALVNLHLDTLTSEKVEIDRLVSLEKSGHFKQPVFDVPLAFHSDSFQELLGSMQAYSNELSKLSQVDSNSVGYTYNNCYFSSPDAEILYTIIRRFKPDVVIEVGSGNSTKIIRQAAVDGQLDTRLISIDPAPRVEISDFVDEWHFQQVERLPKQSLHLFDQLEENDILFIDSSHHLKTGSDVAFLYANVIPKLKPGVLIHIHDIFLPYDYPSDWIVKQRWGWNEQYVVQCMLAVSNAFEILWAGHFLQQSYSEFDQHFPHLDNRHAQSLWLRKV